MLTYAERHPRPLGGICRLCAGTNSAHWQDMPELCQYCDFCDESIWHHAPACPRCTPVKRCTVMMIDQQCTTPATIDHPTCPRHTEKPIVGWLKKEAADAAEA